MLEVGNVDCPFVADEYTPAVGSVTQTRPLAKILTSHVTEQVLDLHVAC